MKTAAEEMSLQTTAENRQWLCRRDVMWQTVPDLRGGNRESSVAVRRQPHACGLVTDMTYNVFGGTLNLALSIRMCGTI